jgi:hypothetical protein
LMSKMAPSCAPDAPCSTPWSSPRAVPRRPGRLPVPRAGPPWGSGQCQCRSMAAPGGPAAEPHIASGSESDGGRAAGARRQCCSQSGQHPPGVVTETPTSLRVPHSLSPPAGRRGAAHSVHWHTQCSASSVRQGLRVRVPESGLRTVTVTPES